MISYLEDWEVENTDKSRKIKTPDWCIENKPLIEEVGYVLFEDIFIRRRSRRIVHVVITLR